MKKREICGSRYRVQGRAFTCQLARGHAREHIGFTGGRQRCWTDELAEPPQLVEMGKIGPHRVLGIDHGSNDPGVVVATVEDTSSGEVVVSVESPRDPAPHTDWATINDEIAALDALQAARDAAPRPVPEMDPSSEDGPDWFAALKAEHPELGETSGPAPATVRIPKVEE